jgi:isocitrate lyase
MLAYVEGIQRQERAHGVETLTHQKWSGAEYYDNMSMSLLLLGFNRIVKTVQGGVASTAALGKGVTEDQFKA